MGENNDNSPTEKTHAERDNRQIQQKKYRRGVIRNIGLGVAGASLSKTVSASEGNSTNSNDDDVTTQAANGASAQFDDYYISPYDSAKLNCQWSFSSLLPTGNTYTMEVYVDADHIVYPNSLATNTPGSNWVFTPNHPFSWDSAYAWESSEYIYDFFGASRFLDAQIIPNESGSTEVKVGVSTFFISDYVSATLYHY